MQTRGSIEFMARHKVASNILMLVLLIGGLVFAYNIKKEVFPDFDLDMITISVSYPNSSPAEVEQNVVLAVEESISDIDGIKEVTSSASEGGASIIAELQEGVDRQTVYQDIVQAVDGITTFADEVKKPIISLSSRKRRVLTSVIYGDVDEYTLREYAENYREKLLAHKDISQVELSGIKDIEIKIAIDKEKLKDLKLSLADVATKIKNQSFELSSGSIDTPNNQILVRVNDKKKRLYEFGEIAIKTNENGDVIKLKDIATINDGFDDSNKLLTYNNKLAISFEVYRTGDQTPLELSRAVNEVTKSFNQNIPSQMKITIIDDLSDVYQQRLDLLLQNGFMGLLLVVVLLGLFLDFKLAFWVAVGIPTSFLGAFIFLPFFDVSINMVSMFAFIVALGIVVDDAIIAGENIYEYRQKGMSYVDSAIEGAKDIAVPLSYAIITNIVAFLPLLFVPGMMGKMFFVIPVVVGTVFAISWVEALYILPRHLADSTPPKNRVYIYFYNKQQSFARLMDKFIEKIYKPFLVLVIRYRYVTFAFSIATLMVVLAYAKSGRLGFELMPRVESDKAVVEASLKVGSTLEDVKRVQNIIIKSANKVLKDIDSKMLIGTRGNIRENELRIDFYLYPSDERAMGTKEFVDLIRQESKMVNKMVDTIKYRYDSGGPGGGKASIALQVSHSDMEVIKAVSKELANALANIDGTKDIDDGFAKGKDEYIITPNSYAQSLGITTNDLAKQIRNAFSGVEAISEQKGRNEVKTRVYLSDMDKNSIDDLYSLDIFYNNSYIPLRELATIKIEQADISIDRVDFKRVVTVEANVNGAKVLSKVKNVLESEVIPDIKSRYPDVLIDYRGREKDAKEGLGALASSFLLVMVVLYITLALPFNSYFQPIIVMIAIPFGIVGAFLGHLLMGYSLSLISVMGIVALSGVVINDTLVLVDYANRLKAKGINSYDSIIGGATRRFRPIFLTTVTTFGGLAPMIFETSRQAKFMIPMAISLGYGILFATFITLVLIPALYMILEDIKR